MTDVIDPPSPPTDDGFVLGRRSDAVRNRLRVEKAAAEVFAEQGLQATVADVAERAGVGNATVYRTYRAKTELITEVSVRWLTQVREASLELAKGVDTDPGEAFRGIVRLLFERFRQDRLAVDMLRAGDVTAEVGEARHASERVITGVLEAAKDAGEVNSEISYRHLHVLIVGIAGRLSELGVTDHLEWSRMAEVVLIGIGAKPSTRPA